MIAALTSPKNPRIRMVGNTEAGGNAPGGVCGALYAAMEERPEYAKILKKKFQKKAGGLECYKIKDRKLSCSELVNLAAKIVREEDRKKSGTEVRK